jgi:sigma-E factor negative regulatory protein RseB
VIRRVAPGWRLASLAATLSLVGSGIAALVLADRSASTSGVSGSSLIDQAAPPGRVPQTAPDSDGMLLLRQALAACQDTPYSAVQVVLWWGQGNPTASMIDVWHQPGQVTVVSEAPTPAGAVRVGAGGAGQSALAGYPDLDGVLGVSPPLLDLLQSNYQVVYVGRGSAVGHAALVVEVRRPRGGLVARFWLDAATKLPLRREIYSGDSRDVRVISEDAVTDLELGKGSLSGMPRAAASLSATQVGTGSLAALRAQGWPLPAALPGSLGLFAVTTTAARSGLVVGASYSDGLSVVSLFVQRGLLAGPMPGWRHVAMAGRTVYAVDPADQGDRSLAWSAGGFVYTLVADAPTATVGQVVDALPTGSPPGFWRRMAHGLHRLASWADPLRH